MARLKHGTRLAAVYRRAVESCDAGACVARFLAANEIERELAGPVRARAAVDLSVIAVGKAAPAMLDGLRDWLDRRPEINIRRTLCVSPLKSPRVPKSRFGEVTVITAEHPVPGAGSLEAGRTALAWAGDRPEGEPLLVLLSGGASSLCEWPRVGLTLDDVQTVYRQLLDCGAGIDEVNAVRAALSQVKYGGLAARCRGGVVLTLVMSDVCGNDLRVVGSGPTAPIGAAIEAGYKFTGTYGSPYRPSPRPMDVLRGRGLLSQLPAHVVAQVRHAGALPPPPITARLIHHIVGAPETLIAGARDAARPLAESLALHVMPATDPIAADLEWFVRHYVTAVRMMAPVCAKRGHGILQILAAEPSIRVESPGRGGRSLHLAARLALELDGEPGWTFLAAGSDGRDGDSDCAGAMVDGTTAARVREQADPAQLLARFETARFHEIAGGALRAWNTRTNVADLHLLLLAGE